MGAYANLAQVKRALRKTDSDRDTDIQLAVDAACDAIEAYCGRHFNLPGSFAARLYDCPQPDTEILMVDDISTPAAIQVGGTANWRVNTHFTALYSPPVGGVVVALDLVGSRRWSEVADTDGRVSVQATYGWGSGVPNSVSQASLLLAARLYKRTDSGEGVLGMTGGEVSSYIRSVDPDIASLLRPYCLDRVSVG